PDGMSRVSDDLGGPPADEARTARDQKMHGCLSGRCCGRPAVKSAAWLVMPCTAYMTCAAVSLPTPQMGSPCVHNSRVLGLYRGPMTIGGAPYCPRNWSEGVPKSVTAATWFAISGDIGLGTAAAGTPGGTAAEVT